MAIADWRRQIDDIDAQIVALLSDRARCVLEIGKAKAASSRAAFVPAREKQIYARLRKLNDGPFPDRAVKAVFREIISAGRGLEEPMRIAFLGPEATFTHVAAYDIFGHAAEYVPCRDIRSVFASVETGRSTCGVVPIENSSEGAVRETLDTFVTSELGIMSEEVLPIHLTLMGSGPFESIRRVASKPIALAQCRDWLAEHLPRAELVETPSTAIAAQTAVDDPAIGVVAHEMAARIYGLTRLREHIEDVERNVTRFLIIGHDGPKRTGKDKTALLCSVKHQAGALVELLNVFRRHEINLLYLYPRPSRETPWEYFFFLDLEGHRSEKALAGALEDAEKHCSFFKVLGSFPRAD
jgi:chorismate mutase/prephenate dehydratase